MPELRVSKLVLTMTMLTQITRKPAELVAKQCQFYGMNGMYGTLIPTGGNQCGLITTSHSPCQMELTHQFPDGSHCIPMLQAQGHCGSAEDCPRRHPVSRSY